MEKIILEKSERQKETNKKFTELLQKYNYDPKTKTIEVDGHRVRVTIDREDPNRSSARSSGYSVPVSQSQVIRKHMPRKIHGIIIGKNNTEKELLHEVGHIRNFANDRKDVKEPGFVQKYGTSHFTKEERRKLNEQKQGMNKADRNVPYDIDYQYHSKKYDKIVDNAKRKTEKYKQDKDQQRVDKRRELYDAVDHNSKTMGNGMNRHDSDPEEYYADLYAMKHGTRDNKYNDSWKKRTINKMNEDDNRYYNNRMVKDDTEADIIRDFRSRSKEDIKRTNELRQKTRNEIAKNHMDAIESVYDLIFESLQERVDSGEITVEFAELVNDLAYKKYIIESEEDHETHMKKNMKLKKIMEKN